MNACSISRRPSLPLRSGNVREQGVGARVSMADAAMTTTSAVSAPVAGPWSVIVTQLTLFALLPVRFDLRDHGLGFELDPAGAQRLAERDECRRAGHHRAAEAAAEPAVVAGVLAVI